ncbi:hypothetical protein FXV77_20690 [Sphingobacterium phlebotomi]|uniref:HD-CE domain-containing protein n=1 Tax=Sphingobacterium phlebotomi TaxID=2605433 RepID=A0A5D4GUT2_9SPHI|nr:ATP-binding protein [Sphingobacterium phlebotomi]TYR31663.1 hypothetical protein FXV77_20690 [Sphingobacterium phlebotomi]
MGNTDLFKNSFDKLRFPNHVDLIDLLLEEIGISETNLKVNLEQIREDFPNLTDHSLEHSRMLWNYAELIIGDNLFLNPLEAYVLHMCFLVHDAGMCYSILNNKAEIENMDIFKDFVALNSDIKNVEEEALFYCVRKLHGEFASIIPTATLPSRKMVINDEGLRDEFSEIIGRVSKSHSMDISYIENELFDYIKPSHIDIPIDCKKLAYILRTSDAAHIDNLRTPLLNREIKENIKGVSQHHWIFQKKIGFPFLENGLLIYRSISSFNPEEKKAWWLCFEALSVLNDELKKADLFFIEKAKKGFAAKGVKAIDNPLFLGTSYIRTNGWQSIDTKIKVSKPNLLAANIGGKRLYSHTYFAVRELIQNAIDAINLRQIKEKSLVGNIIVELKKENNDWYLLVRDNGIGMSRNILINHLLDFGKSYWKSYDFYDDYLGIAQKKFRSIGQFGIGFYSVFMLGNCIKIYSTKYGEELKFQNILSFDNGLIENPHLSVVENNSIQEGYGTTVEIKLFSDPYTTGGFINEISFKKNDLFELVRFLIPDADHSIEIVEQNSNKTIGAKTLSSTEEFNFNSFINLVRFEKSKGYDSFVIKALREIDRKLLPVYQGGKKVGQLAALPNVNRKTAQNTGVILSNGIRVADLSGNLAGYIEVPEVVNLNRNQFKSEITFESVFDWASRYIDYLRDQSNSNNIPDADIDREIKSIQYALGILNENEYLFVYIDTVNNKRIPLTIGTLRNFISSNNEFNHYQLMDTFHDGFSYQGIFDVIRPFSFGGLLCDEDKKKIVSISSLIGDLVNEEWGEYAINESQGFQDFWHLNGVSFPYYSRTIYKRKI